MSGGRNLERKGSDSEIQGAVVRAGTMAATVE